MNHKLAKNTAPDTAFNFAMQNAGPGNRGCAAAVHVLAQALNVPGGAISGEQLLSTLIDDSLVQEVVIMQAEDFLGHEIERARFCRLKTVSDLAAFLKA